MLNTILQELGLGENSIKVYLKLLDLGAVTARQLADNLNMPRPSVYDNLKILIKKGLVIELEQENKKIFDPADLKVLPRLLEDKISNLKKQEKEIKKLLPNLSKKLTTIEPKIRFFNGAEGIKQVLSDLLWQKNMETLTMWPISEMVGILGKDYLENLNRRRIKNKISIRGIWPRDKKVDFKNYPFLGVGKNHLRTLRLAPENMTWEMSYWLYEDKVAFISSQKEMFGFVIHSHDFANLIRTNFEQIWNISTPIKPQPKYTDSFLETI